MIQPEIAHPLNDACVHINRHLPTFNRTAIELRPLSYLTTKILCHWFKHVIAIVDMQEIDYIKYLDSVGKGNVSVYSEDPEVFSMIDRELTDFVYINDNSALDVFKWQDKVYGGGFIGGTNKAELPEFVHADKMIDYIWLARKER